MRKAIVVLSFIGILFGFGVTAGAHRIDEYLQAARLAITPDRITLEMDLTPGYLVNALLPASRNIEITGQRRDPLQRGIQLSFNVTGD